MPLHSCTLTYHGLVTSTCLAKALSSAADLLPAVRERHRLTVPPPDVHQTKRKWQQVFPSYFRMPLS